MRRVLLILLLCLPATAANEIRAFCPGSTTAYAVVRNASGQVWYVTGQVFEAWGTSGRTAADYDIALTDKSGDMFVGDMDTGIAAGSYYVAVHHQVGGSPADSDPVVWYDHVYWSGTVYTMDGEAIDIVDIMNVTDDFQIVVTTVATGDDANSCTLSAGIDANDAYLGSIVTIWDAGDGHAESRMIEDWTSARVVTVDEDFSFTPATSDIAIIWGWYFPFRVWDMILEPPIGYILNVDRRAPQATPTLTIVGDRK